MSRSKTKNSRGIRRRIALTLFLVFSSLGALQIVAATKTQLATVRRDIVASSALSAPSAGFENYLLVGSDSREGADPNDADFATIGGEGEVSGRRSDTLMIFHYDIATGAGALISFPRDLWVKLGDGQKTGRINSAYQLGTDVLIRTIQNEFGIPIHHYLEIDFQGFKGLVDSIGGVQICTQFPSRDKHTGFFMPGGCHNLEGVRALAFARSRFFETKVENKWQIDGSSDIGRGKRQRQFIAAMLNSALTRVISNPFSASSAFAGATRSIITDANLDLTEFAKKVRPAAEGSISRYSLAVYGDRVGEDSVLRVAKDAAPVLAFFGGTGLAPEVPDEN
jgi:LCP family protein required for cell wall assembly